MFCSKCGNKLDENTKYCPKCGTKILEKQVNNKKFKPSPIMIIIIVINIILLLLNIWFSVSTIGTKEYTISSLDTKRSLTLRIHEKRLEQAKEKLSDKDLVVLNDVLVIHENYKVKQYLLVTRFKSDHQYLTGYQGSGFYYVYALDTKLWQLKEIASASVLSGEDNVIREALNSDEIESGQIGQFSYNEDNEKNETSKSTFNETSEMSGQGYVEIALIIMIIGGITYWRYKKTKRISTIVSIIGGVCLIIQIFFVLPHISFEHFSNNYYKDNEETTASVDVDGTYTNQKFMITTEGYGTSYNQYSFLVPGNVKYEEEGMTYSGTYTINDNKLSITYYEALDGTMPVTLDKSKEELTIKDNNTLVTSDGIEYLKEDIY